MTVTSSAIPAEPFVSVSSEIDWEAECTLGRDIAPDQAEKPAETRPRHLFLTGGTGFLGAFLLDELLRRPDLSVSCLVRCKDEDAGLKKLRENQELYRLDPDVLDPSRVTILPGDVSKPDLGLSGTDAERVRYETDTIIHSAARLTFLNSYKRLKPINVEGTRSVLKLACQGRLKRVHYVSTVGMLTGPALRARGVALETDAPTTSEIGDLQGGYPQSKAVAEALVRAASERGVPTTIYRPGVLIGAGSNGAWTTADVLSRMLKTWIEVGVAPDLEGHLDVTPVDYVAAAIATLAERPDTVGRTYHLAHPEPPTIATLAKLVSAAGRPVEAVPYSAWRDRLQAYAESTQDAALMAVLMLFPPVTADASQPLYPDVHQVRFDTQATQAELAGSGVTFPPIDPPLIRRYLDYFASTGFLA